MRRECFTIEIREGREDQYEALHTSMPSEVIDAIAESGLSNYTLFRLGTTVIGYVEANPDLSSCMTALAASDAFQRWADGFPGVFAGGDGKIAELDVYREIWHAK